MRKLVIGNEVIISLKIKGTIKIFRCKIEKEYELLQNLDAMLRS